jgi:hypothetical protein
MKTTPAWTLSIIIGYLCYIVFKTLFGWAEQTSLEAEVKVKYVCILFGVFAWLLSLTFLRLREEAKKGGEKWSQNQY